MPSHTEAINKDMQRLDNTTTMWYTVFNRSRPGLPLVAVKEKRGDDNGL